MKQGEWEANMPAWVYKLSKRRFCQLGRFINNELSNQKLELAREIEEILRKRASLYKANSQKATDKSLSDKQWGHMEEDLAITDIVAYLREK
jgi:hypothetical protein